jgi:type II secretory pathway component PulC
MSNINSKNRSQEETNNKPQSDFHYFGSLFVVLILSFLLGLLSAPYVFKDKSPKPFAQLRDKDFGDDSLANLENQKTTTKDEAVNGAQETSNKNQRNTFNYKIKRELIKEELGRYIVLLKSVGLIPYEDPKTGEPAGFMVTNVAKQSLFYKFGVRENDILKAVDGEPILQMNQAFVMFGKLTMNLESLKTVKLTILRNNQIYTLNYQIID